MFCSCSLVPCNCFTGKSELLTTPHYISCNLKYTPYIDYCITKFSRVKRWMVSILWSHKKVFWMKTGACRDGILKNQPNKMEWHHNTFTPSLHLVPFCQLCLVLVVSIGELWKAVGWVVLGHIYSACWCAWRVSCVLGGCNAIATKHGRYGLSCMQKLWSAQAVLSLYGMLECKLCCEILLLLNIGDILYVEGCGVSS